MTGQGKTPVLFLAHIALIGDSHSKYIQDHFPSGKQAPYTSLQSSTTTYGIKKLVDAAPRNITHFILHFGTNDLKYNHGENAFKAMKTRTARSDQPTQREDNPHNSVSQDQKQTPARHIRDNRLIADYESKAKLNDSLLNLELNQRNIDIIQHGFSPRPPGKRGQRWITP